MQIYKILESYLYFLKIFENIYDDENNIINLISFNKDEDFKNSIDVLKTILLNYEVCDLLVLKILNIVITVNETEFFEYMIEE